MEKCPTIIKYANFEFCTSFAIRQQWLPPGVSNYMVFNFNNIVTVNYDTWSGQAVFSRDI